MYENYRVLFVDDEPNILNSLRRGLLEEEYYCHFAASAKEALEIIKEENIAVIISDIRMPEMNGLELLKLVAERSPMTVKVVLSGYTQLPQILATINQVDIFRFITKPWSLDDLIMIVRKSLDYFIIQEEHANYKKVLEAKNQSYQNILKKINQIIDDAKKSSEMLGICGKAILGFGKKFSLEERIKYQSIFLMQDELFELFSQAVTNEKKKMDSFEMVDHISNHIAALNPECNIEKVYETQIKINVNILMLETAVNALLVIFFDEFQKYGLLSKIKSGDQFTITMIAPHVAPINESADSNEPTLLDIKIDFLRSVVEKVLELCQITFQIEKIKDSLLVQVTLDM